MIQYTAMEAAKAIGDVGAVSVTVAAIMTYVPAISAVLGLIWFCLRIYETNTVQGWIHGKKK